MSATQPNVSERTLGARTFHVKPHDVMLTQSVITNSVILPDRVTSGRAIPDLAILKANFAMPMNGVLTAWDEGVTVTDAPSIAYLLEHGAPATYYIEVKNG